MISHLQMITIYVSDLNRALEFYTQKLDFVKTAEFDDGEQHLIWLVPAGAANVDLWGNLWYCCLKWLRETPTEGWLQTDQCKQVA